MQDLSIHYSLDRSCVRLPGVLIRFLAVAVLFRLDSMKKWQMVLHKRLLPEPVRKWLQIESLAEMVDHATVDWIPPKILLDTLSWGRFVTH